MNKKTSIITQGSQASKNLASLEAPTTYIPSIKVTYSLSPQYQQQKAKLGDFYFNNEQSLGNTIQVTALGYNYQAMAIDKGSMDFVGSLVLAEFDLPFRERKEYTEFCKKHVKDDIIDGVIILLFLPEHNLYGVLFAKKHLLKGGLQILDIAGHGSIVQVKTILKEWKKKSWYTLEVTPTGTQVEVPKASEMLAIHNSQLTELEEGKSDERTR